jgi:exopolysaccharide production protein ExoQ
MTTGSPIITTRVPHGGDLALSLERIALIVASLIPALSLGYMIVIWPLAFGDASISIEAAYFGWLAPFTPTEASSPLKQVAYPLLFLLAVACMLCSMSYRRLPLLRPTLLLVLAFLGLSMASMFWSVLPKLSLMRALLLVIVSLTAIMAVYSAGSFRLMMRAMFVVVVFAAILNVWAVATQPPGPIGHNGIYPQKNFFGWVASVLLFFGLYHLTFGGLLQRGAALFLIASAPVMLIAAQSKTSLGLAIVCPLVALALVYAARRMRLSPGFVVSAGVAILATVYFIGNAAGVWTFYSINEAIFDDGTLTGRTDIWIVAMELVGRGPFLGYGYEAVWATGYGGIAYNNALGFPRIAPTGHNGYVDILLYLGWPGLLLLAAVMIAVLGVAGRLARIDARLGWLSLTVIIFVFLHNNLESDLLISSNPLSMMVLLFTAIGLRMTTERR